jgi:hypothetical protein
MVLADPQFAYLKNMFADRPNPRASQFFYALSAMENDALTSMIEAISKHDDVEPMSFMYDGMIVETHGAEVGSLHAALGAFEADEGLCVKVDGFTPPV